MKIAALFLVLPALSPAQTIAIGGYPATTQDSGPAQITAGPDGAMWFTEGDNTSYIGRISIAGTITEYTHPTVSSTNGIVVGPDGALWFTEWAGNIGRSTTAGVITEYPVPTADSGVSTITAGPDGALWFTESYTNKIGRITTAGSFTEYTVPTANSYPYGITTGPDGALWFDENDTNQIGRITTAGAFTEYPIPTANSQPTWITAGPDGALWFTEYHGGNIGRITTDGLINEYPVTNKLNVITTGPDGALWFTFLDKIGRITTAGAVTKYPLPPTASDPMGIAAGPDGSLWIAEYGGNRIGQAVFVTANLTVTPSTGVYQSDLSFMGTGFAPGENVQVYTAGVGSTVLASANADASGSITASATAPISVFGPRLFLGLGQSSGNLGAAAFSIKPRLMLSPNEGLPGSGTAPLGYGFPAFSQPGIYWSNPSTFFGYLPADFEGTVDIPGFHITVPSSAPEGKNLVYAQAYEGAPDVNCYFFVK